MDRRKVLGTSGEDAAAAFLRDRGIDILMRNFRCKLGEIDILAREGSCWLVIEVKTRTRTRQGYPAEAVGRNKQRKICRVFDYFRLKQGLSEDWPVRFDVIEIDQDYNITWIRNAFEYQERTLR